VLPLHAIAQRADLSMSLVFRLLHTLQHIGWIEKHDRTYRLLVRLRQKRGDSTALLPRRSPSGITSPAGGLKQA
jgi:hypothetical protein